MGSTRKVLSVSFIWFFVLVIFANLSNQKSTITIPSAKIVKLIGEEKGSFHQNLNLNCVSKRTVPTGPDPIHNRRIGSTKLPPT
ncbi:hypothetical protein CDL12_28237 [Handroanthus impetiginosus]|uniref:CLAVATA3/ESR (CLE)-related protein n=1 Tax=Handroanthus impetiginosus TaxID=429701 RepID=A0A2G9G1T2_9LAMI|nr:hypothetical protein CDL12_28237 [Handroanthus impetiginosus]